MNTEIVATKFLLDRIQKLYPTFQRPDEIDIELWSEILEGHSQTEILDALKSYRRETEYNKAPNPAEFKKFLAESDNPGMRARILKCADELGDKWGREIREKYLRNYPDYDFSQHTWVEPAISQADKNSAGGYAESYMKRDINLKRCRHLLPVYQKAVRYIAEELLAKEIPVEQWKRLTLAQRCAAAMEKGLFNQIDNLLVQICRRDYGKDYQFDAENQARPFSVSRAINRLGVHFSANEQNDDDVFSQSVLGC